MIHQQVLIVDDEHAARITMRHLVSNVLGPDTTMCEASSISEAIEQLQQSTFDFLLLDIHLQSANGFDLLRSAPHNNFNLVFTTAYDEYALQAFQFAAVDYLLKPISESDLRECFERMAQRQEILRKPVEVLESLLENKSLDQLMLPSHSGHEVVALKDIVRVQASVNYSVFHLADGGSRMVAKTLKVYEELLRPQGFIRVHQSHLVNRQHIRELLRKGDNQLLLSDGSSVPVSRRQLARLRERLR